MTTLNLKLFVEGFYAGSGAMTATQPITVKVHSSSGVVETKTATLGTDGTASVSIDATGDYFVSVRGWNSLGVFTAGELTFDGTTVDYDFTDADSKAYGNNQVEVESGVFALYSGDVNQNDTIDENDLAQVSDASDNSQVGVVICDLNGDESVDLSDVQIVTNNVSKSVVYPSVFSIGAPNPHKTH